MSEASAFYARFWGVRGSIACGGPDYTRYGGNTSCLEVRCGEHRIIFDAGTGLRELGVAMAAEGSQDCDIFLTHTHSDHIVGIPFFDPFFDPGSCFRLWAGHLAPEGDLHQVLSNYMAEPLFPIPPSAFNAPLAFQDFRAGDELEPRPGVRLRTAPLNHPNRATGYRVDFAGRSICYVTDTEHVPGEPDREILSLIEGADLVVYDSTYTDDEFKDHVGWGHSTWQEGARLCDAAGASTLVIFHHDPSHRDPVMDRISADAEQLRPGSLVAREGMVLKP